MKIVCGTPKIATDYGTGNMILQLPVLPESKNTVKKLIDEGNDKNTVEIKKYRKERSLNANSYMWVLIGKLSEKTDIPSEDIYRDYIRQAGIYRDVELPEQIANTFKVSWRAQGIGWFAEQVDFKGENVLMRFYYGSSRYNTKQLSRVIDLIVQDCESVGIETKTPEQIADMLSQWEEVDNGKMAKH